MAVPTGAVGAGQAPKRGRGGYRLRILGIVVGVLAVGGALGGIGYGVYLMQDSATGTDKLVRFVNTIEHPTPKQQQQNNSQTTAAIHQLEDNFTNGFRQDCDAKAHQLNYLGQQLGGHPDLAVFQSFCAEIGKP